MDQQNFLHLLQEALAADTNRVKAATTELKNSYYKSPESLPLLIQFLTSQELQLSVRQLAATQARSLVGQHWKSIPSGVKSQIRNHLLQSTLNEEYSIIRNAAARVISVIAKLDAEKGQWAELPSLMVRVAQAPNAREREVSTFILHSILDSMGEEMVNMFGDLLALFSKTIHDPESSEVRLNTSRALSGVARALDAEAEEDLCKSFQAIVPGMVAVLKESIDSGDEARTAAAFEGFQTILTCEPQLLNQHFRDLVQFMANIGVDQNAEDENRTQAMSFLITACHLRKVKFQSLRIGEQLTMGMLEVIVQSVNEEDLDDDDITPGTTAIALLNVMTENFPPNQTVAPLLGAFNAFVSSPDLARRRAIVRALSSCAEGAPEFMATQLKSILQGLLTLLDDTELQVREEAVKGVRNLADHLAEDMGKEHGRLIPALTKNLAQAMRDQDGPDAKLNLSVMAACCDALEALVDGMSGEDVRPYVAGLVPHLINLFAHADHKIKLAAVGAVGSMAVSAAEDFMPYFQNTVHALSPYLSFKEGDEELTLRSMACDTMGNLAIAVGGEAFQPYVDSMMAGTVEGMSLGSPRLRETAFLFWSDLAKVYKDDFKPYFPGIAQRLLESLAQEESSINIELGAEAVDLVGKEVKIGDAKVKVAAATDESDMDEDDFDDSDWDEELTGASQVAFEKEVAIECMANIIAASPKEYFPFLEKSIEQLRSLLNHEYEGVQKAAVTALYRIYVSLWELQDEPQRKWEPGLPPKTQPTSMLARLATLITPPSIGIWAETDDRQVAIEVANTVTSTLRICGPAVIKTEDVKAIIDIITSIVNGEHNCQSDSADYDDDEVDGVETSEYDWLLIESSLDVLSGLAKALGAQFAEIWKIFEKTVLRYASSSVRTERISACGVIAECVQGMGSAVTSSTSTLLKILLHRLGDEDEEVKANAAFAVGVLVEKSNKTQEIVKAFNPILAKLEPMLQAGPSRQLDNAAGCVSRMIMKHKDRVPLGDVLPVLLDVLPLKEDFEENGPVYKMIVGLFSSGESALTNLTPQLIPILAQVMDEADDQLDEETKELITQLVRFIHGKKPDLIESHPSLMAAVQA